MTIITTDTRVIVVKLQPDDTEDIKKEMGETLSALIKQGWSITRASVDNDRYSPEARVEAEKIKEVTRPTPRKKAVAADEEIARP
jgi:hypothetical protein